MPKSEIIIRLGGEGGEGVISAGDMFTLGAARSGYQVFTFRTYPSEIKGGHAWYQIRVGAEEVLSMGDGVDVIVAFDKEAYTRHIGDLNPDGVLVYDSDAVTPGEEASKFHLYPVPFNAIAKKELEFVRGKNLLVLGALAALFGLQPDRLDDLVRVRLARRPDLLEKNLESLHYGFDYVKNNLKKTDPYLLEGTEHAERLILSGNQAITAGALHSGCRFFAGYPITPASDIMEEMAKELPRIGGAFLQAEDEIASISAIIGASYAGVKSMTATSGPGFSLMTEGMGLSSMAEIPIVVVDSQRSGPSTGMPTKLEQSDFNHAMFGGHGDFPRVVIAPANVEDAFFQIINAFNLAEKYQLPVIFLSDQSLSHRTETMTMPDVSQLNVIDRDRVNGDSAGEDIPAHYYKRYSLESPDGVSPMSIPGKDSQPYVATGLEHDESCEHSIDPGNHEAMTRKRFAKMKAIENELDAAPVHGDPTAEIGIISWGSTEGPIIEGIKLAADKGIKVAAIHPRVLNPLPEDQLREFIDSKKRLVVVEHNHTGQFARHLGGIFGFVPERLNKYGGLPFMPREILRKIEEVASA